MTVLQRGAEGGGTAPAPALESESRHCRMPPDSAASRRPADASQATLSIPRPPTPEMRPCDPPPSTLRRRAARTESRPCRIPPDSAGFRRIPPDPAARPTRAKLPCPYRARPRPKCVRAWPGSSRPPAPRPPRPRVAAVLHEWDPAALGRSRKTKCCAAPNSATCHRVPPDSTACLDMSGLAQAARPPRALPDHLASLPRRAVVQVRWTLRVHAAPGVAPPQSTTHSRTGTGLAL